MRAGTKNKEKGGEKFPFEQNGRTLLYGSAVH